MRHTFLMPLVFTVLSATHHLACTPSREKERRSQVQALVALQGKAAGSVVAQPRGKPGKLVWVCGPEANLGRNFTATISKSPKGIGIWHESEMVPEMDLLLAEDHRTTHCQTSIDRRVALGWRILTVREVVWSCRKQGQEHNCDPLDVQLDEDVAVPRRGSDDA